MLRFKSSTCQGGARVWSTKNVTVQEKYPSGSFPRDFLLRLGGAHQSNGLTSARALGPRVTIHVSRPAVEKGVGTKNR